MVIVNDKGAAKMEQRHTLWFQTRKFSAALSVEYTGETAKAIQFTAVDNAKCTIWVPKKAVKIQEDNQAVIAHWFPISEYVGNVFERYGTFYNR